MPKTFFRIIFILATSPLPPDNFLSLRVQISNNISCTFERKLNYWHVFHHILSFVNIGSMVWFKNIVIFVYSSE